ncbi:hypothetical protein ACFO0N_11770 [Halobium salinum]|uniref:CARDB domain-containing protein n=1 Tax=Halobium salinum TaxID=1364940 RepID=A0ABD5PD20_9EURY|nr:hypothetical protein [Halobium salinum]
MQRTGVALLALLLVLSAVPLVGPALAVPEARLTVGDVTVVPGTPVTGAPVTVEATVRNSPGSPSAVTVDEVFLRAQNGDRLAEATDLGALSPGDTLVAPLTATFDAPGARSLTVVVVGTDANDEAVRVTRPVTVAVERAPPLVELGVGTGAGAATGVGGADRLVAGVDNRVSLTVSNPTAEPLRNVVVSVAPDAGTAVDARRTVAALDAGAAETLNVTVRPAADATELVATVDYTTARGTGATATQSRSVVVDPLRDDVGVRVEPATTAMTGEADPTGGLGGLLGGGGAAGLAGTATEDEGDDTGDRVDVTVTNFGNAPITDVVVTPRAGGTGEADEVGSRYAVDGPLAPGESDTVTVTLGGLAAGDVRFEATYRVADGSGGADGSDGAPRTAVGTYDYRPGVGEVVLTGLNVTTAADGTVRIDGNAGNTGERSVTGVVVAVGEAPGVAPAYPSRDYFVGSVEGSEFAPFELTATVDEGVDEVPIRVAYTVDGERVEREATVPYVADDRGTPRAGLLGLLGGGRNAGIVLGAAVALGIGAVAFGVVARRGR